MIFKPSILSLFLLSFSSFAGPMLNISSDTDLNSHIKNSGYNGILYVAKDEQVLLKKAYGYKNIATQTPLTIEDKLLIGSNTKQIIAAAILKLQEEEKLSVEDYLLEHLPSLVHYKNIKIKHLLTHTSGIANYTEQDDFWKMIDYNRILTDSEIIDFMITVPLKFEPDAKWDYSNTNYIILGLIIEAISGKSWNEYIHNTFFVPLKMNDSGYSIYLDKVSDVIGYTKESSGMEEAKFNQSWASSAGGIYSTVDDMGKWMAIFNDSNLLSENSKRAMQTNYKDNYGFGIGVRARNGDVLLSHNGRVPGFTSKISYLKNAKLKVVALNNYDGDAAGIATLANDFFADGKAEALKAKVYPMSIESMKDYEGDFGTEAFSLSVYLKDGILYLKPNDGQPAYILTPVDKDSFNLQGISGEEFLRDEAGKVISIKHYQGGKISIFKKR